MNIRDHSSQFVIYVFTTNVDQGASAKVYLSQAGYEAYFFQDPEQLELRLKDNPPHILVFATDVLAGSLNDFVEHVLKYSEDIQFIALSELSQFDVLAQYNKHGFVDVISSEAAALEARIVWAVDRACEKMFLTFQNEQLYADLKKSQTQVGEVHKAAVSSMKQVETLEKIDSLPMDTRIVDYRSAQSKEDLIQKYLNNIADTMIVYFKYLPTVRSFVATHANGIPSSDIQGVGCQLEQADIKNLQSQLSLGVLPLHFSEMVTEAFHFKPVKILPLYVQSLFEGVMVYSGSLDEKVTQRISAEFTLFALCYSHFSLERKVDTLEVQDFTTELFNRSYYLKTLNEEAARARRLQQPLSVIKISLDDFFELESSLGEATRDELLKSLAAVVTKSSRTNDVNCRSGQNEISMILPHCSKKGAALRAERLRRIVEATSLMDNGIKVSISLGVSEYPSLCDSAKNLDETAAKALGHILDKGGNKICLYKAPGDYQPEFLVAD